MEEREKRKKGGKKEKGDRKSGEEKQRLRERERTWCYMILRMSPKTSSTHAP